MRKKPLIIIVIAAALMAFFIFGYLNISKTTDVETNIKTAMQRSIEAKIQAKLPVPKDEMVIPSADGIAGKWSTKFGGSSIAEITLVNGRFELIYTNDPQGRARKYSKGNYKYDASTGRITLYPSKKAGTPKPIAGVSYKIMTLRHYDIFISKKSGEDGLYFTAPEAQIVAKNFHPLFLYADYEGAPVLKFSPVKLK